jgi:hypothetical protein
MSYGLIETATAEGRPYFLYLFAEGAHLWRFTSRASAWVSPAGAIAEETEDLIWAASAVSHGSILQSSDPRRVDLSVSFPLSDPFARRYLGPRGRAVTTLTIFRGHEQVPGEVVAHWKGRIVSARVAGRVITLRCESLFTSLRRDGIRARYQRLCRHALYAGGCRLVPATAGYPAGWFRGGVLRHAGLMGFITGHSGAAITLAGRLPELEAAIDASFATGPVSVPIELAPGCDLRRETCQGKFGNLLNYGGFPDIPGRNPFGGGSIL